MADASGDIIVQHGDTLYALAHRYNVPQQDLASANHLTPPYAMQAGQHLMLPRPATYTARSDDTLVSIARMYHLDPAALARANNLTPPYQVAVGDTLRLPGGGVQSATLPAMKNQSVAYGDGAPPPMAMAATPHEHSAIVTSELLPPSAPSPHPVTVPLVVPSPASANPANAPAAEPAPAPIPPAAAPVSLSDAPSSPPAAPVKGTPRFIWPVSGALLSGFGAKADGVHNDGVNISVPAGTPVKAADDGVVVFSGNQLRGFGNLLLIRHAQGWVTAYAHLGAAKVERGDRVKRGQIIGAVGQTGSVSAPQLHFEVRKGREPVDPGQYMIGPAPVAVGETNG